jgi:3-hydroxyisobutyrate dehydrogenase
MAAVAFLGLGRMGAPMATNLAAAGHEVVLYNRTPAKAEALADRLGAVAVPTPREAASQADVVITMLADEDALLGVCDGATGVLAGLRPGGVLVDMGTTGPTGITRLRSRVVAAGGVLVDAPVSGSTAAAETGGLTILVGAPEATFRSLEPVLAAMGDRVFHLGETGTGSVVKLAVNNVVYALGNALSESLVLAERAGLDRAVIYEVFEHSAISAPMVRYRRDAFLDPERTPAAFAMTLARKDLELITGLAATLGVDVEQAEANLSLFRKAIDAGLGARDMADVAVHLRRSALAP